MFYNPERQRSPRWASEPSLDEDFILFLQILCSTTEVTGDKENFHLKKLPDYPFNF